jgi:hypothetical protein
VIRRLALACSLVVTSACIGSRAPFAPSAVILPDAAFVKPGEAQTFTVQHASVYGFNVRADSGNWARCAQVDPFFRADNSVRVIALRACDAVLFVTADLGPGRSPLVAVMAIR